MTATATKPLNTTNKQTDEAISALLYWLWQSGRRPPTRDEMDNDFMEEETAEIAARYSIDIEGMDDDEAYDKVFSYVEGAMYATNSEEDGCPMAGRPDCTGILYKRF
jgi:hypothetical protein